MYCQKCGYEIRVEAMFCDQCGSPVIESSKSENHLKIASGKVESKQRKFLRITLIILTIAVLVIANIGLRSYLFGDLMNVNSDQVAVSVGFTEDEYGEYSILLEINGIDFSTTNAYISEVEFRYKDTNEYFFSPVQIPRNSTYIDDMYIGFNYYIAYINQTELSFDFMTRLKISKVTYKSFIYTITCEIDADENYYFSYE